MFRDADGNVVRNEDGTPVGSVDVSELPEAPDADVEAEGDTDDLSGLLKADLVARAEEAGIDPTGLKKAELVEKLSHPDTDEVVDDGTEQDEEIV